MQAVQQLLVRASYLPWLDFYSSSLPSAQWSHLNTIIEYRRSNCDHEEDFHFISNLIHTQYNWQELQEMYCYYVCPSEPCVCQSLGEDVEMWRVKMCKSEGYIIVAGPVQDNLIAATGFFPFKPQSDKNVEVFGRAVREPVRMRQTTTMCWIKFHAFCCHCWVFNITPLSMAMNACVCWSTTAGPDWMNPTLGSLWLSL